MFTLGINSAFHDCSACLVKDGVPLAAAEEERFTHIKHSKRPVPFSAYELPFHAIDYCLKEAGINLSNVDHIAYAYDPMISLGKHKNDAVLTLPLEPSAYPKSEEWEEVWDPLRLSSIVNAPRHLISGVPLHIRKRFQTNKPLSWHFVEHHLSHAASAFLPSPYEKAAILTLDGRGEKATTTFSIGQGNQIQRLGEVNYPHSLGILYEKVTEYLGFLPSSDEYKVMALASFGQPKYLQLFRSIIHINGDATYTVAPLQLKSWFGAPREKGGPLQSKHYDIASSLQAALEEAVVKLVEEIYQQTKQTNLCLAGGVALNCVMNSKILQGPFKNIWIQPASGDAGTSLGAAMWIDAQKRQTNKRSYVMDNAYLGPQFSDEEIEAFLKWIKAPYKKLKNIPQQAAEILAQDKVLGWFEGRMEFGPRALGARSILASPIHAQMQAKLNKIKDREDFRPVAPVVLEEETHKWFKGAKYSPFMLFVFDILPNKLNQIPAVKHTDNTARIQTINRTQNPLYYDLIKSYQKITGVPVLVNTSFNTRGEPIVCTPKDGVESFFTSPLDALIIGSFLLEK